MQVAIARYYVSAPEELKKDPAFAQRILAMLENLKKAGKWDAAELQELLPPIRRILSDAGGPS